MTELDPKATALVLIDLQQGIVATATEPHPAALVVENAARLARRFREIGSPVVIVHVGFRDDGDRLNPPVDQPAPGGPTPENWAEIVPELGPEATDLVIMKRQWGAFYGTDLDLQLRRRGIRTIVLGGIATNFGVESTARNAYEHGYSLILVEDATSSRSADAHRFTFENIFPRIGRVRSTEQVLDMLGIDG
ncbi:hydrolase [Fimbriimonas ginsengisoli]|uniref:Nicotinamidase/isochorismatase family protein n=1 Tax=Fimbriimonas ginsengisoli Gsoil 348 TaxID=661478 RepID=A0A068NNY6_FIMGI|nr:hydrolase [Fimbriimonas ginsengisoli]AIE85278.1 Nicotinamidase/isochorismatase family protein [Fimbriimonas ginsengisoli Gsoil 348]